MKVLIPIDMNDVVENIWKEDNETLIQFVKDLDAQIGDEDFTEAMYEYFKREMERYDRP